jgi:hypothetical protein
MRRLTAITLVFVLAFAAAACGGDDKEDTDAKGDTSSTTADDTSSTEGTGHDSESDPDLEAKLLTLDEVGSPWAVDPSVTVDTEEDDDESSPECFKDLNTDNEKLGSAAIGFQQADGFPSFEEDLDRYAADKIEDELDAAIEAIDNCGEFDFDSDGTTIHGKVERLDDFPGFGDDSATWSMELGAEGTTISFLVTYLRKDDIGVSFSYAALDGLDPAPYKLLVDKAVAKL